MASSATTNSSKPTILLVHGAWHNPAHFQPLMDHLEAQGFETTCPHQPSTGATPPTITLYEDAETIRSALADLVERQGKDVIVAMHSYGGVVGTEAVEETLGARQRRIKGLSGGVTHLLYLCAFLLSEGKSLGSAFGGQLPPFIKTEEDGSCNMLDPTHRFYNDLPPSEQAHWLSQLKPHCASAQLTPLTRAAYRYLPSWYLLCEKDQALPLEVQKMMITESEVDVRTESCSAGHSPYLSQPEVVVRLLEKLAGEGEGRV